MLRAYCKYLFYREQLQRPRSGLALPYNHDYMNIQQQEQRALSPYDTQGKVNS